MRVVVDLDSICADFVNGVWTQVAYKYGIRGDTELVKSFYDMAAGLNGLTDPKGVTITNAMIDKIFHEPGFFLGLKPILGSQTALKKLVGAGHEVVILSTPCTPHSASEKIEWVAKHFPFLDPKNVFIGHKKHMVVADFLIDDAVHNAISYREHNPDSMVIGISYPYNRDHAKSFDFLADSYADPVFAWGQLYNYIMCPAL